MNITRHHLQQILREEYYKLLSEQAAATPAEPKPKPAAVPITAAAPTEPEPKPAAAPATGGGGLSGLYGALKKGVGDVVGGAKAISKHVVKGVTDPKYAAAAKTKEAAAAPAEDTEAEVAKANIRSAVEAGGMAPGEAMARLPAGKSGLDTQAKATGAGQAEKEGDYPGYVKKPGTAGVYTRQDVADARAAKAAGPVEGPPESAAGPDLPPAEKKSYGQGRRDINAAFKAGKIDKSEWRKQRRAHTKTKPARGGGGGRKAAPAGGGKKAAWEARKKQALRRTGGRPQRRPRRKIHPTRGRRNMQENQMLLSNTSNNSSAPKKRDPLFTSYPDQKAIFDNWRDFLGEKE